MPASLGHSEPSQTVFFPPLNFNGFKAWSEQSHIRFLTASNEQGKRVSLPKLCKSAKHKLPIMFVVNLKFQTNVKDETEQQR